MPLKFKVNIIQYKKFANFKLPELKKRVQFLLSLMCDFSTEVSIKFCDAEEMLQTNQLFLKKSYATDVLSFPSSLSQEGNESVYLGDILICLPVCLAQSKKAKVTFSHEVEKMLIHGLVHLKGFDHERNRSAWNVMSGLESLLQKELVKNFKKPTWCSVVI